MKLPTFHVELKSYVCVSMRRRSCLGMGHYVWRCYLSSFDFYSVCIRKKVRHLHVR
jgi:hypothetical protein